MKINKKGFTLIELLISITIFMILVVMSFVPYQYYSNIAKVKLASKEISQSIAEARNLAINGYDKNGINQSVAIYFDAIDNSKLKYYSYNYSSGSNVSFNNSNLLKEKLLPEGVIIKEISGMDKLGLFFSSISGTGSMINGSGSFVNLDTLEIKISYKGSLDPNLNKNIIFYKNTNLTDY